MTVFKRIFPILRARPRISSCDHGLSRFEEGKRISKRFVPSECSRSLATKPVPGVIAHITAMLNATQIAPMPKISIARIQNRQLVMSSAFSWNIEVRERDARWNTGDGRCKGVLLRTESTGRPSRSIGKSTYPSSTLDRIPKMGHGARSIF
jgi:hypothetical protein